MFTSLYRFRCLCPSLAMPERHLSPRTASIQCGKYIVHSHSTLIRQRNLHSFLLVSCQSTCTTCFRFSLFNSTVLSLALASRAANSTARKKRSVSIAFIRGSGALRTEPLVLGWECSDLVEGLDGGVEDCDGSLVSMMSLGEGVGATAHGHSGRTGPCSVLRVDVYRPEPQSLYISRGHNKLALEGTKRNVDCSAEDFEGY